MLSRTFSRSLLALGSIAALSASLFIGCGNGIGNSYGTITTYAGTGEFGYTGDGGKATSAKLYDPYCLTLDASGNLFIGDYGNNTIRKVDASSHIITTYAGTGVEGYAGDGGPASSAQLYAPMGCAIGPDGDLYFTDRGNRVIRKVDHTTSIITTAGGPYSFPTTLAFDHAGNLYIADKTHIRRVNRATNLMVTIAGNGSLTYSGDGGAATNAGIGLPAGFAFDAADNIYFSDPQNGSVRRIDKNTGIITAYAGTGVLPKPNDVVGLDHDATQAQLTSPRGLAFGPDGSLYIADASSARILRVQAGTGILQSVVGAGENKYDGDGGPSAHAHLHDPADILFDSAGNLYIADNFNAAVRKVTPFH